MVPEKELVGAAETDAADRAKTADRMANFIFQELMKVKLRC
jgi:hypothetical protein